MKAIHALTAVCMVHLAAAAEPLQWRQTETRLALLRGTSVVWQLVYDPAESKSYFHPLATSDGRVLTACRPADHVWHRGLWFSWKFINGVNYWEEDKQTGRSAGLSELRGAVARTNADGSASAELTISYHPPDQPEVLAERRTIRVSAPDAAGAYVIDWMGEFTAGPAPVTLDRTPPAAHGGPGWGGYGGMSLRLAAGAKGWSFLNSAGQTGVAGGHGKPARWVDFAGPAAGVTIFEHPGSPRHPAPWYLNDGMPFFGAAPLFESPLSLPAGGTLTLRYRVLIRSSPMDAAARARYGFAPEVTP